MTARGDREARKKKLPIAAFYSLWSRLHAGAFFGTGNLKTPVTGGTNNNLSRIKLFFYVQADRKERERERERSRDTNVVNSVHARGRAATNRNSAAAAAARAWSG